MAAAAAATLGGEGLKHMKERPGTADFLDSPMVGAKPSRLIMEKP